MVLSFIVYCLLTHEKGSRCFLCRLAKVVKPSLSNGWGGNPSPGSLRASGPLTLSTAWYFHQDEGVPPLFTLFSEGSTTFAFQRAGIKSLPRVATHQRLFSPFGGPSQPPQVRYPVVFPAIYCRFRNPRFRVGGEEILPRGPYTPAAP